MDKILQSAVATGYVHNVSQIKNGKYFDFWFRAVCFSPPKRNYFSKYSKSNVPVEIRKVRVDTNRDNTILSKHRLSKSWNTKQCNFGHTKQCLRWAAWSESPSPFPYQSFTVWKTENNSGTPSRPFRHNKGCVMARVFECSCRGKCKDIFWLTLRKQGLKSHHPIHLQKSCQWRQKNRMNIHLTV